MKKDQISRFHAQMKAQQFEAAFEVCTEAIRDAGDDWNAIYLAGITLRFQGDSPGAIDYYRRALQYNPDVAVIWQALGIALQSLRRFPEAIDALSNAIRLDPDGYASHNSLGLTYKLAGHYISAMRAYEDALQVRINHAFAEVLHDHPELFRAEQQSGSKTFYADPAFLQSVRQIIVTDFDYFNTVKNMITCCVAMGDHHRARELQEDVDTCTPIDPDINGPVDFKQRRT